MSRWLRSAGDSVQQGVAVSWAQGSLSSRSIVNIRHPAKYGSPLFSSVYSFFFTLCFFLPRQPSCGLFFTSSRDVYAISYSTKLIFQCEYLKLFSCYHNFLSYYRYFVCIVNSFQQTQILYLYPCSSYFCNNIITINFFIILYNIVVTVISS